MTEIGDDLSRVEESLASVFREYDTNNTGVLDQQGLASFWQDLGVLLDNAETSELYSLMAAEGKNHRVTLKVIHQHLVRAALSMNIGDGARTGGEHQHDQLLLLPRLLVAEREGWCPIHIKAFIEHLWKMQSRAVRLELKRSIDGRDGEDEEMLSALLACQELSEVQEDDDAPVEKVQAASGDHSRIADIYCLDSTVGQITAEYSMEHAKKFKDFYLQLHRIGKTDIWEKVTTKSQSKFANLERKGENRHVAMREEGSPAEPINVGLRRLVDLFAHLDGKLAEVEPEYVSIRARWNSKTKMLQFPADFDGVLPIEVATAESLRYYNCTVANSEDASVEMLYPGEIHNFTYEGDYLDNYVKADCGDKGASLERHLFPHLDCPKDKNSGVLVIGKYVNVKATVQEEADEEVGELLHLTGFQVPPGQVVYIPNEVIHTNNYLQGTWTTMLSDQGKTPIDTVKTVKGHGNKPFSFSFTSKAMAAQRLNNNIGESMEETPIKREDDTKYGGGQQRSQLLDICLKVGLSLLSAYILWFMVGTNTMEL